MATGIYNDRRWTRIRPLILERDGHHCQLQLRGCKGQATEVDHIIEWSQGGAPFDPDNLRASCKHCNVSKRNTRKATRDRQRRRSRDW